MQPQPPNVPDVPVDVDRVDQAVDARQVDPPSSPAPILFLLPALVAAGITGGFTSIVIEQLDRRLRSARDIDKELGVSCIGLVPKVTGTRRLAPQRILIDSPFDPYTEAIRSVVTAALMPLSHEPVVFPVTSSRRGEGTTTLAISFAAYAAYSGAAFCSLISISTPQACLAPSTSPTTWELSMS